MSKKFQKINSFLPRITDSDRDMVADAVSQGWGDQRNKYIELLEEELSTVANRKYVLAVSHGTDAIHLALAALDLSPGDEVIVPDLTWVACITPILHLGLTPILVNVDENLCMSPESFKAAISNKTKAAIVVDLAGLMPEWRQIHTIAQSRGIKIIEDAAESLGAYYDGFPAGSFGDVSILSFSATKVITGGHGGAVMTNNQSLYKRMQLLKHHGIDKQQTGKYFWSTELGYNFQLSNIQAALIYSQLLRLKELIQYKKSLYHLYENALSNMSGIILLKNSNQLVEPSYWLMVAILDEECQKTKEEFLDATQVLGVEMRPLFYLLSEMPPFRNVKVEVNHRRVLTQKLSSRGICLPYGYDLRSSDIDQICEIVQKCL